MKILISGSSGLVGTKLVHKLIKSNWIRTISWTVRAATCFVLI